MTSIITKHMENGGRSLRRGDSSPPFTRACKPSRGDNRKLPSSASVPARGPGRSWAVLILACACLVPVGALQAADKVREYLQQFVPLSLFMPPKEVDRTYLKVEKPVAPWKVEAPVPTPAELAVYREKLAMLKQVESEQETQPEAPPIAPTDKTPQVIPPRDFVFDPTKPRPRETIITTSPLQSFFDIKTPQPGAKAAVPDTSSTWYLRRPTSEQSDVYIPFSLIPNVENPPPASSAVIYHQPEAGSQ